MKRQGIEVCPSCHSKNIGRLTLNQYFCRECYVEIIITKKKAVYVNINSAEGIKVESIRIG